MNLSIKNAFQLNQNARDIIVLQDSTKMAVIVHPEKEELFTMTDWEDYLAINVNASSSTGPFDKKFRISYPFNVADHLVYCLGKEDIKVEYNEVDEQSILKFPAGPPQWQLLISPSIPGSDDEDAIPTNNLNITVTVGEE